jgi:hypothetical protein
MAYNLSDHRPFKAVLFKEVGKNLGEKMKQIPKKLYKYGSFEKPEYLKEVFLENKIYCTSLFNFNDPFDCRPRISSYILTINNKITTNAPII